MGVFIELRCDSEESTINPSCWSYNNLGPGLLSDSTLKDIKHCHEGVITQAKKEGWLYFNNLWFCPECIYGNLVPDQYLEKIRIGVAEECNCPEEEWIINNVHTTIHLEPDGSGHILLDAGDWENEKFVEIKTITELRQAAINWVNSLKPQD